MENVVKPRLPHLGARLRRLRRLRGLKQAAVAEIAQVTQTTVSRWESGELEPNDETADLLLQFLRGSVHPHADGALRRLVEASLLSTHLIIDHDHHLLAASKQRQREWGKSVSDLSGVSLWRFATEQIEDAERRLDNLGWWTEIMPSPVQVNTEQADHGLAIAAGCMLWERLYLSDGTPARLCTSLATPSRA
jgi:transcriptional regulator with XRE-family HTH domain